MLGSRCLAFSTSSSTERWPVCEKKVSTIKSRCRVDFSPRAAIQLARRSWAAVETFFGTVRFILKLILSLEKVYREAPGPSSEVPATVDSARPAALPAQLPPCIGILPDVAPGEAHQRRVRPLADRRLGVLEPLDHVRGVVRSVSAISGHFHRQRAHPWIGRCHQRGHFVHW